jgi:hypothetical protein
MANEQVAAELREKFALVAQERTDFDLAGLGEVRSRRVRVPQSVRDPHRLRDFGTACCPITRDLAPTTSVAAQVPLRCYR